MNGRGLRSFSQCADLVQYVEPVLDAGIHLINTTMITPDLIRAIRSQYRLPWRGIHGVTHWARVLENGLRLARLTGANVKVVQLFALFHDSRRFNEDHDPQHGERGAQFASSFRGTLVHLSNPEFHLLDAACQHHTQGKTHDDITVQTCWDADRLDLGRVGIEPDPLRLCTKPARTKEILQWAYERSCSDLVPDIVAIWEESLPTAVPCKRRSDS